MWRPRWGPCRAGLCRLAALHAVLCRAEPTRQQRPAAGPSRSQRHLPPAVRVATAAGCCRIWHRRAAHAGAVGCASTGLHTKGGLLPIALHVKLLSCLRQPPGCFGGSLQDRGCLRCSGRRCVCLLVHSRRELWHWLRRLPGWHPRSASRSGRTSRSEWCSSLYVGLCTFAVELEDHWRHERDEDLD